MTDHEPSTTAVLVAKSLLFLSKDPQVSHLLPEHSVRQLRAFLREAIGWSAGIFPILGAFAISRWIVRLIERLSVPGMIMHYLLRKKKIEQWLRTALDNGAEQLVILGAGLDTLGLRVAQDCPNVAVYELDHPATQAIKARAFASKILVQPENFNLLPQNLTNPNLANFLTANSNFSFSKKTVFIAEGLLMYLTFSDVLAILATIRKVSTPGSTFVFSYMENDSTGRPAFSGQSSMVNTWLKRKSEPFVWGTTPENLALELGKVGLHLDQHCTGSDLKLEFLQGPGLKSRYSAIGENLSVASSL